jgi:succinate-semialdehyde dehydrogenase/glutarate-semialdehyde dehydrogenase
LEKSVEKAIKGRTMNCGQICFSPKRFIIEDELYEKFRDRLIEGLQKIKYGDPMDKNT